MKSTRWLAFGALIFGAAAASAAERLSFIPVTPCRVVDTRQAPAGRLAAGEVRSFVALGNASFAVQGGPAAGCGLPPQLPGGRAVRAVVMSLVAVEAAGPGHLKMWAADSALPATSVLNYSGAPQAGDVANQIIVAVRQDPAVNGDFKAQAAVSGVHIVADLVGYLAPLVRTVLVSPVPNDPIASGAALLEAAASIPVATATDPWLVKLEPGIYDLGAQFLTLEAYVDVEGSGRDVTVITAQGAGEANRGTVVGADHAELRALTIENRGGGFNYSTAIFNGGVSPALRGLRVRASGRNPIGIHGVDSAAQVTDVDVAVRADEGYAYAIWNESPIDNTSPPAATFEDVTVVAEGQAYNYGIYNSNTSPSLMRVTVVARGGADTALYNSWNSSMVIRDSSFNAEGGGSFDTAINTASNVRTELHNVIAVARGLWSSTAVSTNGGTLVADRLTAIAAAGNGTGMGLQNCSAYVQMFDSQVSASGGTQSYGFWNECFPGGRVEIHGSTVAGGTGSLLNLAAVYQVLVGTSQLTGPVDNQNGSSSKCVASYDPSFNPLGPSCVP